jgi:hypothetical protein
MVGEPLRARRAPSLTELLTRRALELVDAASQPERPGIHRATSLFDACALVDVLLQWEPAPRASVAQVVDHWISSPHADGVIDDDRCLANLFDRLDRAGDRSALHRYVDWARTLRDADVANNDGGLLALAARHPRDAEVDRWTHEVVQPGRWLPDARSHEAPRGVAIDMDNPEIALPAVRDAIIARLRDTRPIGILTVERDGSYRLMWSADAWDSDNSAAGSFDPGTSPWRVCDAYARWLDGDFSLRAAIRQRDAAIRAMIVRVQRSQQRRASRR